MGCKASKDNQTSSSSSKDVNTYSGVDSGDSSEAEQHSPSIKNNSSIRSNSSSRQKTKKSDNNNKDVLYQLFLERINYFSSSKQQVVNISTEDCNSLWTRVLNLTTTNQICTSYVDNKTKKTPLHLASMLIDYYITGSSDEESNDNNDDFVVEKAIKALINSYPDALSIKDCHGNIPIHYVIQNNNNNNSNGSTIDSNNISNNPNVVKQQWIYRTNILGLYMSCFESNKQVMKEYFNNNNLIYSSSNNSNSDNTIETNGVSALYYALQIIPDDFYNNSNSSSITIPYINLIVSQTSNKGIGNSVDGDTPLSLLYRRFTRQFDLSEKFFDGDNSRSEVVNYRRKYKIAASNTWKLIELCLLKPTSSSSKSNKSSSNNSSSIVHCAVQVITPPDLLRYIVETNSDELTQPDNTNSDGGNSKNLPLHYAAVSGGTTTTSSSSSYPCSYYSKYVIDELLYKFPEGASIQNANGLYPLELAMKSNKPYIGGGIKSLYDAYPDAINSIPEDSNLFEQYPILLEEKQKKSTMEESPDDEKKDDAEVDSNEYEDDDDEDNDENDDDTKVDEQHDAIMLVQKDNVDISEIVTCMWAFEEDAGVQMLGCMAITKKIEKLQQQHNNSNTTIIRMSLSSVAAVVNAMKAHPNEPIVQEKAILALRCMAISDGKREISFVALGGIAAIVGAMQAHVNDDMIQQVGCSALSTIINSCTSGDNNKEQGADRATIVASVSGLTAIINSIASHPDNVHIQKEGCLALKIITDYSIDNDNKNSDGNYNANLPELPKSQTAPLLQHAIDNYPNECKSNADIVLSRLS